VKELQDYVDRMELSLNSGRVLHHNKKEVNKKIRSTKCAISLYEKMGVGTRRKVN
jgi:hypothetical protein